MKRSIGLIEYYEDLKTGPDYSRPCEWEEGFSMDRTGIPIGVSQ